VADIAVGEDGKKHRVFDSKKLAKVYEEAIKITAEDRGLPVSEVEAPSERAEDILERRRFANGIRTRTLDSHASRLRRKLEAAGAPGVVVNDWGVGYRLLP
jgi:hypothetical protein